MRISILGNSDTNGAFLPPGVATWPVLLQERLEEALSEPVEVESWRFVPVRRDAVEHALERVTAAQPDLVIVPLPSYWCAFGTVQARVEKRLGHRAAVLYARGEQQYSRRVEGGVRPGKPRAPLARRLARRVLGTAPWMTVQQFVEVHASLIQRFALREELQVLVLGDHHYNSRTRSMLPRVDGIISEIEAAIRPVVVERKLLWADVEQAIFTGDRRDEMVMSDGIHMTEEAHERVATALRPIVETFARGR